MKKGNEYENNLRICKKKNKHTERITKKIELKIVLNAVVYMEY